MWETDYKKTNPIKLSAKTPYSYLIVLVIVSKDAMVGYR